MSEYPSYEQIEAIKKYAGEHGRHWRSQLLSDWLNGRSEGELQQVRNAFGPSWLMHFKLPK